MISKIGRYYIDLPVSSASEHSWPSTADYRHPSVGPARPGAKREAQ